MYKCPRCSADLKTIFYEGVEIETCTVCEGEWLDAGELREIVQTVERRFSRAEIQRLDRLNRKLFKTMGPGAERLACPKCKGVKLRPFNYACSSGIILDKCPRCGGIWLDRGELELVQALVEEWNGHVHRDPVLKATAEDKIPSTETSSGGIVRSRIQYVLAVLRSFV